MLPLLSLLVPTNIRMQVLPPANGKKLWRVRRSVSSGKPASSDSISSLECLNNSLRISAAGKSFSVRRPPMKRPKSKPGMPKDFVFVDLSPVKSSDEEVSAPSSTLSSPTLATTVSVDRNLPLSLNESFDEDLYSLNNYNNYNSYSNPVFDDSALLGLGLLNVSYDGMPQQEDVSMQMQQDQLAFQRFMQLQSYNQLPTPQMQPRAAAPVLEHKRSKLSPTIPRRKSAGGFQFKTYKGPNTVRKPLVRKNHRRCVLEPSKPSEIPLLSPVSPRKEPLLEEFLHMPKMDAYDMPANMVYTPFTDISETEDDMSKPMTDMTQNQFLFRDEFDLLSFVSL